MSFLKYTMLLMVSLLKFVEANPIQGIPIIPPLDNSDPKSYHEVSNEVTLARSTEESNFSNNYMKIPDQHFDDDQNIPATLEDARMKGILPNQVQHNDGLENTKELQDTFPNDQRSDEENNSGPFTLSDDKTDTDDEENVSFHREHIQKKVLSSEEQESQTLYRNGENNDKFPDMNELTNQLANEDVDNHKYNSNADANNMNDAKNSDKNSDKVYETESSYISENSHQSDRNQAIGTSSPLSKLNMENDNLTPSSFSNDESKANGDDVDTSDDESTQDEDYKINKNTQQIVITNDVVDNTNNQNFSFTDGGNADDLNASNGIQAPKNENNNNLVPDNINTIADLQRDSVTKPLFDSDQNVDETYENSEISYAGTENNLNNSYEESKSIATSNVDGNKDFLSENINNLKNGAEVIPVRLPHKENIDMNSDKKHFPTMNIEPEKSNYDDTSNDNNKDNDEEEEEDGNATLNTNNGKLFDYETSDNGRRIDMDQRRNEIAALPITDKAADMLSDHNEDDSEHQETATQSTSDSNEDFIHNTLDNNNFQGKNDEEDEQIYDDDDEDDKTTTHSTNENNDNFIDNKLNNNDNYVGKNEGEDEQRYEDDDEDDKTTTHSTNENNENFIDNKLNNNDNYVGKNEGEDEQRYEDDDEDDETTTHSTNKNDDNFIDNKLNNKDNYVGKNEGEDEQIYEDDDEDDETATHSTNENNDNFIDNKLNNNDNYQGKNSNEDEQIYNDGDEDDKFAAHSKSENEKNAFNDKLNNNDNYQDEDNDGELFDDEDDETETHNTNKNYSNFIDNELDTNDNHEDHDNDEVKQLYEDDDEDAKNKQLLDDEDDETALHNTNENNELDSNGNYQDHDNDEVKQLYEDDDKDDKNKQLLDDENDETALHNTNENNELDSNGNYQDQDNDEVKQLYENDDEDDKNKQLFDDEDDETALHNTNENNELDNNDNYQDKDNDKELFKDEDNQLDINTDQDTSLTNNEDYPDPYSPTDTKYINENEQFDQTADEDLEKEEDELEVGDANNNHNPHQEINPKDLAAESESFSYITFALILLFVVVATLVYCGGWSRVKQIIIIVLHKGSGSRRSWRRDGYSLMPQRGSKSA